MSKVYLSSTFYKVKENRDAIYRTLRQILRDVVVPRLHRRRRAATWQRCAHYRSKRCDEAILIVQRDPQSKELRASFPR